MYLSSSTVNLVNESSWIRRMFEAGGKLKAEIGEENVFDFSLGNPTAEPPALFTEELRRVTNSSDSGLHRYMMNQGYPETRRAVAEMVSATQSNVPALTDRDVVMTIGAAGAISSVLKAVLEDGDEVVAMRPFFGEYEHYISNRNCSMVLADTDETFGIDVRAVESCLSDRTRVVLICSPNNPTGRCYDSESLIALGKVLENHERKVHRPVFLINDAVYGRLVFEEAYRKSALFEAHVHSIVCGSFSKDMSLAGDRVGYIALNPRDPQRGTMFDALGTIARVLGFVNAPCLTQHALVRSVQSHVDVDFYKEKVEETYKVITEAGLKCERAQGGFFLFPQVPGKLDDVEFVECLKSEGVLAVPGRGFGMKGYIRVSCVINVEAIRRSAASWKTAVEAFRAKNNAENPHAHC